MGVPSELTGLTQTSGLVRSGHSRMLASVPLPAGLGQSPLEGPSAAPPVQTIDTDDSPRLAAVPAPRTPAGPFFPGQELFLVPMLGVLACVHVLCGWPEPPIVCAQ